MKSPWIPRPLRVAPVLDPAIRSRIEETLELQLRDSVKGGALDEDARSVRRAGEGVRSQLELFRAACRAAGGA